MTSMLGNTPPCRTSACVRTAVVVQNQRMCENCGAVSRAMQTCTRCKHAFYCCAACQKACWKTHKPVCTALKGRAAELSPSRAPGVCFVRRYIPTVLRVRPSPVAIETTYRGTMVTGQSGNRENPGNRAIGQNRATGQPGNYVP